MPERLRILLFAPFIFLFLVAGNCFWISHRDDKLYYGMDLKMLKRFRFTGRIIIFFFIIDCNTEFIYTNALRLERIIVEKDIGT